MRKVVSFPVVILFLLQMFIVAGCEIERPNNILSQGKMEDVLYDYHIARAMAGNLPPTETYKAQLYIDAVFKAHGITQAEFNTSLEWYSRNAEEMSKIYENVQKRLNAEISEANKFIASTISNSTSTASGDSIDLWTFSRTTRLNGDDMNNKLIFTITADSTFHERDAFEWSVGFICTGSTDVMHAATMTLSVRYMNDSTLTQTMPIMSSGLRQLRIQNDTLGMIREIRGFIYLPKGSPSVLLANVSSLKRYHAHRSMPAKHASGTTPPNTSVGHEPVVNNAPVSGTPAGTALVKKEGASASPNDTSKAVVQPPHRLSPEELNKKRNNTGTPRGYEMRQQALEKELQEKRIQEKKQKIFR